MAQRCDSCSSESPGTAKFCLECGRPLARACPSCGAPAGGGKFCGECGTALTAAVASPATEASRGPVSERRTTTVLFGDLVSFTTYSESRDPEEVRELLSAYFAVARTVVGRYGGTIEKFIGDAVMAVWGVPVSHEDDAERAVRAGLDLVTEVAALGESNGAPGLSMRVGIVTGSVAVTLGATNEGMVAGDAVNTAARVQTAAEPGSVWTDQETRGLTEAAVTFTDMGEHPLKGKAEPARLFRADMVVGWIGGAQRVDGLQAPMTGRDAELRQVKELFHLTQQDGRARLVVVSGIAGVGKSRLGWEFEKYVDGLADGLFWHRGRCLSYGDGVALWAFAEMIRSRLQILDSDDRAEIEGKARAGVEAVARDAAEAAWLAPRLAALVSGDPTVVFERTDLFAAWTTFLERLGAGEPVVLLFEDMQHADSGLLDFIDHLRQTSRAALFVVLFARPELLERRPALVEARGVAQVTLAPLSEESMRVLVDGLVGDLPLRARTALVARSEGVPLYAVETVRSLIDQDAVVARDGRYVFVDHEHTLVDLDRIAAPTSLQTLIAARLDTLTPTERRTVQDASVLGMTFPRASLLALAELGSYELDAALAALVGKGVLETNVDPRSPDQGQFRFLQAMVREVAYSTLARSDRRARHLAVAAHLDGSDSDTAESLSGIIAQHLLDALAASSDHDPERPSMSARARALLTVAAGRAEALGSPEEALADTLAALALDPGEQERVGLWERAARVATQAGHADQGQELAARAVAGHEQAGNPAGVAQALMVLSRALVNLGRVREANEAAQRGDDLATAGGGSVSPATHIELLGFLAWGARVRGDSDAQLGHAMRAMVIAERLKDPALLVRSLNMLSTALMDRRMATVTEALLERSVVIARQEHLLDRLGLSLSNLLANGYASDLSGALVLADEAVPVVRQVGDLQDTEVTLANGVFTWWLAGQWDRLLEETAEWVDRDPTATCHMIWLGRAQVQAARGGQVEVPELPHTEELDVEHAADVARALVLHSSGDLTEAARVAAAASRRTYGSDASRGEDFEVLWSPTVELQLAVGDVETAAELLDLAAVRHSHRGTALLRGELPRLRGMVAAARGEDPEADLRAAEAALEAYGATFLLARTRLELGRWLHQRGRTDEARPLLALARPVFEQLRAAPSIAELDAVVPAPTLAAL